MAAITAYSQENGYFISKQAFDAHFSMYPGNDPESFSKKFNVQIIPTEHLRKELVPVVNTLCEDFTRELGRRSGAATGTASAGGSYVSAQTLTDMAKLLNQMNADLKTGAEINLRTLETGRVV